MFLMPVLRLALGGAQIGFDYGITNTSGKLSDENLGDIIELAEKHISIIDIAPSYGDAERRLGEFLKPDTHFKIITKTPPLSNEETINSKISLLMSAFEQSLSDLKQTSVYGILIHDVRDLIANGGKQIFKALQLLKDKGLVKKIGVSVYHRNELDIILSRYSIDIVQFPMNMFNRTFDDSVLLGMLKKSNIELHVRSIFLQGLLLTPFQKWPSTLANMAGKVNAWEERLQALGISRMTNALDFIKSREFIDYGIVGVSSVLELESIIDAYKETTSHFNFDDYALDGAVDPGTWEVLPLT
jgi:aryl-alcohol dehydrogenase-like predicted oxidoreductase